MITNYMFHFNDVSDVIKMKHVISLYKNGSITNSQYATKYNKATMPT